MDKPIRRPSHLFTVRLWVEHFPPHQREVRGRVQHVLSGDVSYFRSAGQLATFLVQKMEEMDADAQDP